MSERQASNFRRATATPAEQKMMVLLSNAKIPYRWQEPSIERFDEPQKVILGNTFYKTYRPDFGIITNGIPSILVEVDGDAHTGEEDYELKRDKYLESRGYTVMHFTNRMVMQSGKEVIAAIQTELARPKMIAGEQTRRIVG